MGAWIHVSCICFLYLSFLQMPKNTLEQKTGLYLIDKNWVLFEIIASPLPGKLAEMFKVNKTQLGRIREIEPAKRAKIAGMFINIYI